MTDVEGIVNRAQQQAQATIDSWQATQADREPIVVTSEDEEVEIELTADLVVTRVTLRATATRDPQKLEDTLVAVINDAVTQARASNPVMQSVQARMGKSQQELEEGLAQIQGQLADRISATEAYFAQLKSKMGHKPGTFIPLR